MSINDFAEFDLSKRAVFECILDNGKFFDILSTWRIEGFRLIEKFIFVFYIENLLLIEPIKGFCLCKVANFKDFCTS